MKRNGGFLVIAIVFSVVEIVIQPIPLWSYALGVVGGYLAAFWVCETTREGM